MIFIFTARKESVIFSYFISKGVNFVGDTSAIDAIGRFLILWMLGFMALQLQLSQKNPLYF